ncbi:hypothetical protein ACGFZP_30645 [Kitasatospora sp. NPDC048239]
MSVILLLSGSGVPWRRPRPGFCQYGVRRRVATGGPGAVGAHGDGP